MTTIRLHDSMARGKRDFVPVDPQNVRLYVCGPTVYDRAHIGNARPVVVFDVLFRLLRHVYGRDHVTYVRNITDIDDKIIDRARERGVGIDTVTRETAQWFQDDMAALGCLAPTHQPRATEHVPGMVAMIAALIALGKAYAAEGHVLFEVGKFPDYGRLSGRSTDDMIAGARVEVAPYKRDPMDFVLWKPSTPDQPGWDSPWGRGRPGWHIECSAMSRALLGGEFDIHGGGADLMFPHHENEIAQSRCAHPGEGFARYWLHNGMVRVDGRKMSKSLGNFFTVQDKLAEGVPGEVIRLALLMTHYRDTMDWTEERVRDATKTLRNWAYACLGEQEAVLDEAVSDALLDDLNTPEAISELNELYRDGQSSALLGSVRLLGLDLTQIAGSQWARLFEYESDTNGVRLEGVNYMPSVGVSKWGGMSEEQRDAAIRLIHRWLSLRRERRFEEADALRTRAMGLGVELRATRSNNGINTGHAHLNGDISTAELEALK